MDGLVVDRTIHGDAVVVRAQGEIDSGTVAELVSYLTTALEMGVTGQVQLVVIDLTAVTFFGSVGLNAVLDCYKQGSAAGTPVRLVADNAEVIRPIEVTNLDTVLAICPSVSEALGLDPEKQS